VIDTPLIGDRYRFETAMRMLSDEYRRVKVDEALRAVKIRRESRE
jgi:hypothetical protein